MFFFSYVHLFHVKGFPQLSGDSWIFFLSYLNMKHWMRLLHFTDWTKTQPLIGNPTLSVFVSFSRGLIMKRNPLNSSPGCISLSVNVFLELCRGTQATRRKESIHLSIELTCFQSSALPASVPALQNHLCLLPGWERSSRLGPNWFSFEVSIQFTFSSNFWIFLRFCSKILPASGHSSLLN